MTNPFDVLEREHHLISRVLDALERAVEKDLPRAYYARAADFLGDYADAWHHAKEEAILFRYLEEHGMPRDYGPIGVMLSEHDYGRKLVTAMRDQVEGGDRDALVKELAAYITLLREHIMKEDSVLFPMGRATLTQDEIERMGAEFDAVPEPEPSLAALEAMGMALIEEAGAPA